MSIYSLTDGRQLLMLMGVVFLGEDETLVTRTKIAYQRGVLSLAGVISIVAGILGISCAKGLNSIIFSSDSRTTVRKFINNK